MVCELYAPDACVHHRGPEARQGLSPVRLRPPWRAGINAPSQGTRGPRAGVEDCRLSPEEHENQTYDYGIPKHVPNPVFRHPLRVKPQPFARFFPCENKRYCGNKANFTEISLGKNLAAHCIHEYGNSANNLSLKQIG